ncbi:Hsp20/alpha crystallin family protein [Variovorax sp. PAMC 28711]|uniref:Hsp20/alpha crystallin family protein n=1 Tax=Variovorax sp. PAMC 28711 TaxID=1795631 RepID=UPI00078CE164|nr:Hsp20/alpha crystallin family protein [Variovorax sp. PAMC 28711]AMM25993.1 heat-shock protein Hsp20 [Variovorax sp. PAMC 28711]
MYRSLFPRDMYAELEQLQRDMQQALELSPAIRGFGRGGFPALNVGSTGDAIHVHGFAPGLDPATLDISLDRGILTVSGERPASVQRDAQAAVHINERFAGRFQRVLSLPEDADPEAVNARYENGILRITVPRRASAQPRRIPVQ